MSDRITPLAPSEITDEKVKPFLDKAAELGVPDARFVGIMAQAPGQALPVMDAMMESLAGDVDPKLKEVIRVRLARQAGDPYFAGMRSKKAIEAGLDEDTIEAGCGDFEADDRFTDAEKWALRYAALMYTEPQKVNAAFYEEGKKYYSEAEIMEIGTFIAFHYGLQVWVRTLAMTAADA